MAKFGSIKAQQNTYSTYKIRGANHLFYPLIHAGCVISSPYRDSRISNPTSATLADTVT